MPTPRTLNLLVGLSLIATGLLGAAATREVTLAETSPVSAIALAPSGSRLFVHGMLERLRPAGGSAVVSSVTDCAGNRSPVFFSRGPATALPFSLVILEGVARDYKGVRELVVDDPEGVHTHDLAASVLTPEELLATWRSRLCQPVAFTAPIAWAAVNKADVRDVDVAIAGSANAALVVVHLDAYPTLSAEAGASVTFIGILAAAGDGQRPVVHVRA
jgi:hypothetical protein